MKVLHAMLLGGAFDKPVWLYRLDFVVYPLLAIALTACFCRDWWWAAGMPAGILLFSFAEYWVHRTVLHEWFMHEQHERHHTHPTEYTVFPIYVVPGFMALAFLALPLAMFTGFLAGYCWFITWHHVLHHTDLAQLPAPVRRYSLWHLAHHRLDDVNFGITMPIWDIVFGTFGSSHGQQ